MLNDTLTDRHALFSCVCFTDFIWRGTTCEAGIPKLHHICLCERCIQELGSEGHGSPYRHRNSTTPKPHTRNSRGAYTQFFGSSASYERNRRMRNGDSG
ncbi:hypothetical protein UPYG_G00281920 [Umbra pygmaea]|uniref:Uncharacterized protein n=1 Tax=Umbra pygmaea TaxID=75934 RepID=A0ABD0WMJ5_UMBPY